MIRSMVRVVYNVNEKLIATLQSANERIYSRGNIGPLPFDTMVAELKQRSE